MTMPNGSPLAPHAHNWINGDIEGLRDLAGKLQAYVPRVQDMAGRLTVVAQTLTCDGPNGWQGRAADAFMAAWGRQSRAAAALEDYVTAVATAVDMLAVELSHVEHALEEQAREAAAHGVRVGDDGTVTGYTGERAYPHALAYENVRQQALASADTARTAAAQQLNNLYQQAFNPNQHPNSADYATLADVFANLAALPTAERREVTSTMKKLQGQGYKLDHELAEAKQSGGLLPQKTLDESVKTEKELQEVQDELKRTGRLESSLSKLLDTRTSDVDAYLQGAAGPGRHVRGNTPEDLRSAASEEPGIVKNTLEFAESIPVVDVAATVVGTGIGTYYDMQDGKPLHTALPEEALSNSIGTIATNGSAEVTGAVIGDRIGAAGGPVGLAVGAVVGFTAGDVAHYAIGDWHQEVHDHGVVDGTAVDVGHAAEATTDDGRELIVGLGHKAEHAWDDLTGS